MGSVFEDMCKQYLMSYENDLPILLNDTGRWWGTDPVKKKEIDLIGDSVIGTNGKKKEYIAASCKFRNREMDMKDYSKVFDKNGVFYYYLFSICGFKDDVREQARKDGTRLVSIEEMYGL